MKKITVFLTVVVIFIAALTSQANDFIYTTDTAIPAITITGYQGPGGTVIIPSSINGIAVTTIADDAFGLCTNLTRLTIPNSITKIGEWAFGAYTSLTNITVNTNNLFYSSAAGVLLDKNQTTLIKYPTGNLTGKYSIPGSVTTIEETAFTGCTSLTRINIPDSVTTIGEAAFCNTGLTNITIPNSVITIGEGAFDCCTSLINVTIPKSVTTIGTNAFDCCTSLTNITVETNNLVYSSAAGVLLNKNQTMLIQYPAGLTGKYSIPDTVTTIGEDAFSYCTNLTGISIPNSVTTIGDCAFGNCISLTSISIPNSVTIEEAAFYDCTSLTNVTISNSVTIGAGAFYDCTNLTSIYFTGNAPNPDSAVFYGDSLATAYYLPNTSGWGDTFDGIPAVNSQAGPMITSQPTGQTVLPGQTAAFSVVAANGSLSYQWQFEGTNVPGGTEATLTLARTQPSQAGPYCVVINNPYGAITSAVATLTVTVDSQAPNITAGPQNMTIRAGKTTTLSVTATGLAPMVYQWYQGDSGTTNNTPFAITLEALRTSGGAMDLATLLETNGMPRINWNNRASLIVPNEVLLKIEKSHHRYDLQEIFETTGNPGDEQKLYAAAHLALTIILSDDL